MSTETITVTAQGTTTYAAPLILITQMPAELWTETKDEAYSTNGQSFIVCAYYIGKNEYNSIT